VGESYSDSGNVPSGKSAFFKDITIYGLSQHKWVSYVLINPLIKSWDHDTYSYNEGSGTMQNSMTIEYETVKYYEGAVGKERPDNNVVGFAAREYYDTIPSSLARPGSTQTVLGQGGILDAGIGIIEDLQSGKLTGVIGAIQKAGTTYNTFKGKDIRSTINEEANAALKATLRSTLPGYVRSNGGLDAVFLRSLKKINTNNTTQGQ
jgi:hypothetical protein